LYRPETLWFSADLLSRKNLVTPRSFFANIAIQLNLTPWIFSKPSAEGSTELIKTDIRVFLSGTYASKGGILPHETPSLQVRREHSGSS
jgi:hypothetical protein